MRRCGMLLPLVGLLAGALFGCAGPQLRSHDFVLAHPAEAEAENAPVRKGKGKPIANPKDPDPLGTAKKACEEDAQNKSIRSLAAIFSRLKTNTSEQDYINCMRDKGYEVKN